MTVGSLFTGYGGIDMGLEMCGLGPVRWQAESDAYARSILARHWPNARCYSDVREIDETAEPVDLICGGFPCQDLSLAGKQAGLSAERSGLWWEFRRIVRQLRPRLVFIENIHGGWRKWLPVVRRSLWKIGYASLPLRVSAAEAGAPHRRARCFLLAYAHGLAVGLSARGGSREGGTDTTVTGHVGAAWTVADVRGIGEREPEPAGTRPREATRGASLVGGDLHPPWIARDANVVWQLQPGGSVREQWRWTRHADGWAFGSPVPGVDDGTADRLDRERLCGNGAVPQQVALAFRTLMPMARAAAPAIPEEPTEPAVDQGGEP